MANKKISDLANTQTTPYSDTKMETEYDGQSYQMALSTLLPSGMLMPYAGATVPNGWLECDGSAVSRTTYSALFTAIGTTWGAGDGSTTFNLPDFRGLALEGTGTNATGTQAGGSPYEGAALGAIKNDQMQRITGDSGIPQNNATRDPTSSSVSGNGAISLTRTTNLDCDTAGGAHYSATISIDSADSPNARTSATTGGQTNGPRAGVKYCIKY